MSDDLQEQLEIGKQAETFNRYVNENPYFLGLLERVKLEYARRILDLMPEQKDDFASFRSKMDAIGDVMEAVRGDIFLGAEAMKKIDGVSDEAKGIL
jgi:hypothetical protein